MERVYTLAGSISLDESKGPKPLLEHLHEAKKTYRAFPDWVSADNFSGGLGLPMHRLLHYLSFPPSFIDSSSGSILDLPPRCMLALPRSKQILIFSRLHLRRTALRLLSSPSSFVVKPRTITSFASSTLRIPRQSNSIASFQRRWATGEAEAKKEEPSHEAPISEIQPTPQQEVGNAIHEGNSVELKSSKPAAEAEGSPEPTREEAKAATNTTQSGVNTPTEAVSNATSSTPSHASEA